MDRTLIILKPDALERGLGDEIIGRIEAIGLTIATSKEMTLDRATAELHYAEHEGKPVGFGLWFYSVSTFDGRPKLYVEDVFVEPAARGFGIGRAIFGERS